MLDKKKPATSPNQPKRLAAILLLTDANMGISKRSSYLIFDRLLKYQPSFMVMLGHAAGNKNMPNTNLGNILIAKESVDYHQVEIVQKDSENGDAEFVEKDKKYSISINVGLLGRLESYMQNKVVISSIKQSYPDNKLFEKEIICKSGKFVTGGVLMRSEERFKEILTQNPGTIGLDLETHGFYYACENTASANKPFFVSIKSVSDFGDHNTAHPKPLKPALVRQQFAAFTSANFFHEFIFANY